MKTKKRNIGREIINDLKEFNATLEAGIPLHEKFTVRTVRFVPDPGHYDAAGVQATRQLVGVSQPIFARMLGVSPPLVRSWECGQRISASVVYRLLARHGWRKVAPDSRHPKSDPQEQEAWKKNFRRCWQIS